MDAHRPLEHPEDVDILPKRAFHKRSDRRILISHNPRRAEGVNLAVPDPKDGVEKKGAAGGTLSTAGAAVVPPSRPPKRPAARTYTCLGARAVHHP